MESLGGTASARAVFGEPIEKDGVTVVPVARVRFGVGGGGGRGPGRKKKVRRYAASGYGHGGGVQATPAGYIELSGGKASYKRIGDPARPMAVALLFPIVGAVSFGIVALVLTGFTKSWRSGASRRRGAELTAPPAGVI